MFIMVMVIPGVALGCGSQPKDREDLSPMSPTALPTLTPTAGPTPTNPPLLKRQKDTVVAIVRASGVVERINEGQEWESGRITRADLAGALGVSVEVKWREPVESSGPWVLVHCEGTRKSVISESWSQVTRMEVVIDLLDPRFVAGYAVIEGTGEGSPVSNNDGPLFPPTIYEVETKEVVFESTSRTLPSEDEVCPPGTIDRNQIEFR